MERAEVGQDNRCTSREEHLSELSAEEGKRREVANVRGVGVNGKDRREAIWAEDGPQFF
jgi:hypothetical protein